MSAGSPVLIPLLSPNEPEVVLSSVEVSEGEWVEPGQVLCVVETTKTTEEVVAETSGHVVGLAAGPGDSLAAGTVLCHLASDRSWSPPTPVGADRHDDTEEVPAGLRITRPARALAAQLGVNLAVLPIGPLVSADMVREAHAGAATAVTSGLGPRPSAAFDGAALVLLGGGGHGRTLIDLVRALGSFVVVGVVDDALEEGSVVAGVPVLGDAGTLGALGGRGIALAANGVGGIARPDDRVRAFARLAQAGLACPPLVHPAAWVEPTATVAAGAQVLARAYVGSGARVGFGAIVNTGAVVSHDCVLGDCANVAPGALLAGGVRVGDATLVGMGVTVHLGVTLGGGARIGNGAVVNADVAERAVVRAGTVWPG